MGETVEAASNGLAAFFEPGADRAALTAQLQHVEHRGDELLRTMLDKLATSFVTPLDREDILRLASLLDDAVDDIYHLGQMIHLMNVETTLPEIHSQLSILLRCGSAVSTMMASLENLKGSRPQIEAVQGLESEADTLYRSAVAALFSGSFEPLEVMKLRDVVGATERCIDGFEDIADVVDSIRVKQS